MVTDHERALARWLEKLQKYHTDTVHRTGTKCANAMSRSPTPLVHSVTMKTVHYGRIMTNKRVHSYAAITIPIQVKLILQQLPSTSRL